MRQLIWDAGFVRSLKRTLKKQPSLRTRVEQTLRRLVDDPFDPALGAHKLKGKLAGTWACCVAYDLRILFRFVPAESGAEENILLIDVGTHEEVY